MPKEVTFGRRRFLGMAVAGVAAGGLGVPRSVSAAVPTPPVKGQTSFGPVKQIKAGVLDIGYVDVGSAKGRDVILLHGWPYDIHSYVEVAPMLAAAGYRVIVPHLRGFGTTRFLSKGAFRNAQQSAVAFDVIALMDALDIRKAIVAGYDWGARTADVVAVLWPDRCKAIVSANGYLITNIAANRHPAPPKVEWAWWYQYYFATERGKAGYAVNLRDFNKLMWRNNSPSWNFDDATFNQSAASWDNPDQVAIVIHNYRWRLGLAAGEPRYDVYEQRLSQGPVITVPAITVDGAANGVAPATDGSAYRKKFSGKYAHTIIQGAGHNLPQEAPRAFADLIVEVDSF